MATNARYERAQQLCREFPDADTRTLAKRLAREFKCTIEQARSSLRRVRGQVGKAHRKHATVPKKAGKAGAKPKLPPSQSEEWKPLNLDPGKTLCLSDIHIPYHDSAAVEAAVTWARRRKPDTVLLNGDTLDFYTISRWIKDPRKRDFKAELEAGVEFLRWLRNKFSSSRIIFKVGNHEDRWNHWLWNSAPEICDLPHVQLDAILELDDIGIELIGDGRPVQAGSLPIFHGHELPKGMTNPVNMARGAFLRMLDTVLVGHGHRSSSHTEPSWMHTEVTTWSQGCLCNLYPEYARINKWNHGFAFIEHESSGEFDLQNLRISKQGKVRAS